jgi:hypothetical protein
LERVINFFAWRNVTKLKDWKKYSKFRENFDKHKTLFLWYWGLNSGYWGLNSGYADALPLESPCQPCFLFGVFEIGSCELFPSTGFVQC